MLKGDDKKIIRAIKAVGLDHSIFERDTTIRYLTLLHKVSGLQCTFSYDGEGFNGRIIGRFNSLKSKSFFQETSEVDLEALIEYRFIPWLEDFLKPIVDDESEPDPWITLDEANDNTFSQIDGSDSSEFLRQEKESINESLLKFQKLIERNFELGSELKSKIESELKYLSVANNRLNKRDWKAVAQKIIYDVGVSIAANVSVETAKSFLRNEIPPLFWKLVKEAFIIGLKLSR